MGAATALGLAAILIFRAFDEEEVGGSRQPPPELFPVETQDPVTPEVEQVQAAVDASRDRWTAEVVSDAIEQELAKLADAIREGDRTAIAALLHEEFRASSLGSTDTKVDASPLASTSRHAPSPEPILKARRFPGALLEWASSFQTRRVLAFKIIAIEERTGEEGRSAADTEVLYEMAGTTAAGDVVSRRGAWTLSWIRSGGAWTLRSLESGGSTTARAEKPFYVDVSAGAFGDVPSYWEQMRLGLDDFRASVDAASGIGVYGHQGVSVSDIDGDGLEDLFVAQPSGLPNRLYKNLGDGTFRDVSREAGVDLIDRTSVGLFADMDNDGDRDLIVVLQNRAPRLLLNDGQGKFALSESARFERKRPRGATLTSAAVADYDGDGFLDLYVGAYTYFSVDADATRLVFPYPYHDATNGPPNTLYRNRGDGTFQDVTSETGLDAGNDRYTFAVSWGDFDRDGHPDLYVANDFGRNNLYQNLGNGRFEEISAAAGVEDIGAGMSVAWTDYDLDGRDDLYVGNMWSSAGLRLTRQPGYQPTGEHESYVRHAKGSSLFRNLGEGRFEEVTAPAGVALGRWAWSSDFFDVDNDGDEDLYIANGFITNRSTKDL